MEMTFKHTGEDFSGFHAAEKWCKDNGYCVGAMQGPAPIGLARGKDIYISKWRNLSRADIAELDGQITFDGIPRGANATVKIKD